MLPQAVLYGLLLECLKGSRCGKTSQAQQFSLCSPWHLSTPHHPDTPLIDHLLSPRVFTKLFGDCDGCGMMRAASGGGDGGDAMVVFTKHRVTAPPCPLSYPPCHLQMLGVALVCVCVQGKFAVTYSAINTRVCAYCIWSGVGGLGRVRSDPVSCLPHPTLASAITRIPTASGAS